MSVGGVGGAPRSPQSGDGWSIDPDPPAGAPDPPAMVPDESSIPGLPGLSTGPGGVSLLPRPLYLPDYDTQGSSQVSTLGESALEGLKGAAAKNTTGPEAELSRFIQGEIKNALRSIRADEAKAKELPLGSARRGAIEDKIDARVRRFKNDVALRTLECADEIKRRAGGDKGALDGFKSMLPGYLRDCIDRSGAVIPGVPGAFTPRTDNGGILGGPTGLDYKVDF